MCCDPTYPGRIWSKTSGAFYNEEFIKAGVRSIG